MHTQQHCTDEKLQAMLESDAQAEQFTELLQHVEHCSQCQQRLDRLAASEDQWKQASQMLAGFSSSDTFRSQPTPAGPVGARGLRPEDHPAAWTESMARQLLTPASHPEMLGRIGRYEVERLIGSGGMGIVFKAIDTELNRPVAIKILAPYLAGSGPARQRFAREAKAAAAVVHEHVVPIHNVETDGQSPFLVMRFVAGESLQARIDRKGALDLCQTLRIAHQVAAGLHAAHSQGLVHRDIKPSNILVESGVERSLITDFGLARAADDASLTNTGYHPGTPQFMSPEQARGEAIDARSDLFSLGSVMYTMCTGRPPFRAETSYGVLRRITDTEPRKIQEINPLIPNWLCGIVSKLMSKSPDLRYQSAEEIAKLLELCLAHVQHPLTHQLPAEAARFEWANARQQRWPRRLAASAVVLALAMTATIVGWNFWSRGGTNPDSAGSKLAQHQQSSTDKSPASRSEAVDSQSSPLGRAPRRQLPVEPADRVRQHLAGQTKVEFNKLAFQEAAAAVLQSSGVKFQIAVPLFEAASIDVSKPSSLQAAGSIYSLLNRVCQQYEASYIVGDTGIEIVPLEHARSHPSLRYYDLAYVLPDNSHTGAVIFAIEQLIEPEDWTTNGGSSSIQLIDSVIVVRATELAHQQMERLLSQLVSNSKSPISK